MDSASCGQAHGDWHSSKLTTLERAKYLLETGLYADCEFLVGGSDGSDQELRKAHQLFLAMSSPVFDAMFFGKMTRSVNIGKSNSSPQNEPISIPDLTPSSFKDLLQHIYANNMDLQSIDQAIDLHYAARKYILPDLVSKCVQYIQNNLTPDHTCRVFEFAKLFDEDILKAKCWALLKERTGESLAHPDFEEISESTLLAIVKEKVLYITELELFDAVKRWAGRQCAQKELEINGPNMRQMLNGIIYNIRFYTMTSEEFSSSPAISGILTERECMAIFMNSNNPGSWPEPASISTSRTPRRIEVRCLRQVEKERRVLLQAKDMIIVNFTADQDVTIKGIIIAPTVLENPQLKDHEDEMILECEIFDSTYRTSNTAPLSHSFVSKLKSHPSTLLDSIFKHTVLVKANQKCCITISVEKNAHFLSGNALPFALCNGIQFKCSALRGTKDGLVRGFIFSPCEKRSGVKRKRNFLFQL